MTRAMMGSKEEGLKDPVCQISLRKEEKQTMNQHKKQIESVSGKWQPISTSTWKHETYITRRSRKS